MTARALRRLGLSAVALLAATAAAMAAPVLRAEVTVNAPIVTVGDMFENAGMLAETALFRAPAPGTTGTVSLDAVHEAAARAGLDGFEDDGVVSVRVARPGVPVDAALLRELIAADLTAQGVLREGMAVDISLAAPLGTLLADRTETPVALDMLNYRPGDAGFSARFALAGHDQPLQISGRLELTIEAPHLARALPAGTVLGPDDLELRPVPVQFADAGGVLSFSAAIGQQLQRQSRAGMLVRPGDVAAPQVIARNELVTVYLRSGALTLTVRGQALNNASAGQSVAVLNLASNRVIHGTALASGAVELAPPALDVAGL